jgi:hypothetical protein
MAASPAGRARRPGFNLGDLLSAIRNGMLELGIPLLYCGVNIVDVTQRPASVISHSMNPQGEWHRLQSKGSATVLKFWEGGQIVYRSDLEHDNPVRCVIDIPFLHGTLALNHTEPDAFSDEQVGLLQEMAETLEEANGWRPSSSSPKALKQS